jgi:hypothetical protein
MNKSKRLKARGRSAVAVAIAAAMIGFLTTTLWSADTTSASPPDTAVKTSATPAAQPPADSGTNKLAAQPGKEKPAATEKKVKPAPREFSGAEIYSMNCFRCHPERYPNERTSAQWKTIVLHMRVRANLTAKDANTVLKYLQDNSGY